MFFQEGTPDTSGYMIAGYAVAFVVMIIYVLSLYVRNRNLKKDLTMLDELDSMTVQPEISPPKPKQTGQPEKKTVTKRGRQKQS
jgi:hypothetical protein